MEMFRQLGLKPQEPFAKGPRPVSVEATEAVHQALGEKPRWTRPGHTIERNEQARSGRRE
jgi:biotin synthase